MDLVATTDEFAGIAEVGQCGLALMAVGAPSLPQAVLKTTLAGKAAELLPRQSTAAPLNTADQSDRKR